MPLVEKWLCEHMNKIVEKKKPSLIPGELRCRVDNKFLSKVFTTFHVSLL